VRHARAHAHMRPTPAADRARMRLRRPCMQVGAIIRSLREAALDRVDKLALRKLAHSLADHCKNGAWRRAARRAAPGWRLSLAALGAAAAPCVQQRIRLAASQRGRRGSARRQRRAPLLHAPCCDGCAPPPSPTSRPARRPLLSCR
jgi:hypothetical protein